MQANTGADEQVKVQLKARFPKVHPPLGWADGSFWPRAWTERAGKEGGPVTAGVSPVVGEKARTGVQLLRFQAGLQLGDCHCGLHTSAASRAASWR